MDFRNKQMINSYLILAIMILTSFRFAFTIIESSITTIASPILWITFFFSGMFALSPTYKREVEQGTREGLLLAPISPSSVYFGKFLANLLVIILLELFTLVLFFVFFPVDIPDLFALLVTIVLGTIGFTAMGNVISAISANMSQSEVMLPVLLVPLLLFTVIMSAVSATSDIFSGGDISSVSEKIKFISAFDVVFVSIGYLLIDYILED